MARRLFTSRGCYQGGQFTPYTQSAGKYLRHGDMHEGMRVCVATGPLKGRCGVIELEPGQYPWMVRLDGDDHAGFAPLVDLLAEPEA